MRRNRVHLRRLALAGAGAIALYAFVARWRSEIRDALLGAAIDEATPQSPSLDNQLLSSDATDAAAFSPKGQGSASPNNDSEVNLDDSSYVPFFESPLPATQTLDSPRSGTPEWLRESEELVQAILTRSPCTQKRQSRRGAVPMRPAGLFARAFIATPEEQREASEAGTHTRLINADSMRPAQIELDVSLNVMSLFAIDTVEQRFSCEFALRCRTLNASMLLTETGKPLPTPVSCHCIQPPHSSSLRHPYSGERVTHSNFEPRIRITNLIAVERWRMRPSTGKLAEGELEFKYTIAGTLAEPFQLSLFPWDVQTLTITLSSAIPRQFLRFGARGEVGTTPWPHIDAPWAVAPHASCFSESNVFTLSRSTYYLLLTTYYVLRTTYYLLLTSYFLLLTT